MSEECAICGVELKEKFCHTLNCNHTFHYDCLLKSFSNNKKYRSVKEKHINCPYCREKCDYLPVVNGVKNIIIGVHVSSYLETKNEELVAKSQNKQCEFVLTRGKNKGNQCCKNSLLGFDKCKSHLNK